MKNQIPVQVTQFTKSLECDVNMKCFSYKIEHDYGLAPNPFHGYCTLAVCKSQIRANKNLEIGDWIIGVGSQALGNYGSVIFAMYLEEKLTFNEYWNDERFANKKPVVNGSLVQMYGDNFYHKENGKWIQEDSAHSKNNGINKDHLERDIGGKYVLISKNYYYFGRNSLKIPKQYMQISPLRGARSYQYRNIPEEVKNAFINWLKSTQIIGIHGEPTSWDKHISQSENKEWDNFLQWEKSLEQ